MACPTCGRTHDERVRCVDVWIGSAEESAIDAARLTPRTRSLIEIGEAAVDEDRKYREWKRLDETAEDVLANDAHDAWVDAEKITDDLCRAFDAREVRVFGPKTPDHPSVGAQCPACKVEFKPGDYTTLIALGPGDDSEEQEKARQGRPYNAVAAEVHAACAGLDP